MMTKWKIYKGKYTLQSKLPPKLELLGVYDAEDMNEVIHIMGIYQTTYDEDIYAICRTQWRTRYILAYKRDLLGELDG